jgi:two-component system, cell cycle response regulator DivK
MSGQKILLVDDMLINLKVACAVLCHDGYHVETAQDGEEALQMLRDHRPDLIVSDIQMPKMDGLQLARAVKQDSELRKIPLIALTAFSLRVNEAEAFAAGFDGYMTKPIDTRTFGDQIREYLRLAKKTSD